MAQYTQCEVCLDVAVDHRIRRLFRPVVNDRVEERSKHVSSIKKRGRLLERSPGEIQVTAELAGPAAKGGIAVTLLQPRDNHPFDEGLQAVINECKTLHALNDIFAAVSCGTLDIGTDITVVDLLPYVSEKVETIDDAKLMELFRASAQIICEKEPGVLLCAGKISQPRADGNDYRRIKSIGVGKKFGTRNSEPATVKIRHEDEQHRLVTIRKVNGFHPSHAMNHNPHNSLLRQLLILIGAETCGMFRGDWEDEEWMDELRHRCQDISRSISGKESPCSSQIPS